MIADFKTIEPSEDKPFTVSLSIAGGSGTGKTYSALLLARGLAGDKGFAVLDTENLRAKFYKAEFPDMTHYDFGPIVDGDMVGFPPERWIAALDDLEDAGHGAVVIDSFSHAWEGINGVLELQALELASRVEAAEARANGRDVNPDKFTMLAWAAVKPRYRRLINRIIQSKMHVVICIRAKEVQQSWDREAKKKQNARDTKLRRNDLPWDIASDRDLIFEMTAAMLMVPAAPGQPVLLKCADQFTHLFPPRARITPEIGVAMREWSDKLGAVPNQKAVLDGARIAARKGVDALNAYATAQDKDGRAAMNTILMELRTTAREADAEIGGGVFIQPEEEDGPSQEEIAKAMAEAEAKARDDIAAETAAMIEAKGPAARGDNLFGQLG